MENKASRASLNANQTIDVRINRLLPGGLGLAHDDASRQTVLVALAAPGDLLRVRIDRVQAKTAFASILEVLEPSSVRVAPPCPYFGRCGGCDFQQLTYTAQLQAKSEIIEDCLRRIARLTLPAPVEVMPAPSAWRYRLRARWQYDAPQARLGYYELKSHEVCDVAECPVVVPAVQNVLTDLRQRMKAGGLPENAYEFQAVAGDDGVALKPSLQNIVSENETSTIELLKGETTLTVNNERLRFSADCFFQISHDLLEPLVHEATKHAGGNRAVDLYCGVGLFTLPLARRVGKVIGVEANERAVKYARMNLKDAKLDNTRVEVGMVGEWLRRHAERLAPVDMVLLDPPRTGVEAAGIDGILKLRPKRITYVSCDPATLARDLQRMLFAGGYALESIGAFDLFPQTHHVETVVHLRG